MSRTEYEGLRIVVTGGSSGLGLALAEAFVRRGASVALVARDAGRLDEAARAASAVRPGAVVRGYSLDVTRSDGLGAGFDRIAEDLGGIDLLVSSAGILIEGYFQCLRDQDFRAVMDVNFFGAVNAARAALPHLERSRGRILNVASMAALTGVFGYAAYCASKHALLGVSDVMRVELAPRGVRVQVACPGEFQSPMVEALDRTRTPENREHTLTIPKTTVDVVVKDVLRGLDSGRFVIIPGFLTRLVAFGIRHFPALSRWVGDLRVRAVYVGPKTAA
jgi:3-dehydrosphinganine reductase